MNRIYLKEIYITNKINNKKFITNNVTLRNRFKLVEDKLIIFFEYNNSEIQLKKEIKIIPTDNPNKYTTGKDYTIYLANDEQKENTTPNTSILGKGKIKQIDKEFLLLEDLSVYINKTYTKDIKALFNNVDDINKFNNYLSKLFKIYYYSIIYFLEMYNYPYGGRKISALASYLAIINNLNYNFSYPNVFIKDNRVENDLLLLKDKIKNDKYCYEKKDVKAIIEIKSCGYIENKDCNFERYIKFNFNETEKENQKFLYQVENIKNSNISYIYFSLYERNYKKYKEIINKLPDRYIGIFCSSIEKSKYIIPDKTDISL